NKLLRDALAKDEQNRTLAEKSAIDAESCALGILGTSGYTLGAKPSYIPDGAIKEVSFLDPRQIKAIHASDTSMNYDQPIEERQPLEIRATQIDLDQLRMKKVKDTVQFTITTSGGDTAKLNGPGPEYLLPNSGIIFASRNDALPDLSTKDNANEAKKKLLSASDFKLDPTRRPNGIVLINGAKLSRNNSQNGNVNTEKGLIMVSDLPVYIKGDFNKHTQQEFTEGLTANTWNNFYTRTSASINNQFACRPGDSRLPKCTTGDDWRAATVLSDGVTLLSNTFRYGFRIEGDFDLINNAGNTIAIPDFVTNKHETSKNARLANGFFENNFAINGLSSGVFDS
ncbi:MAG: hormogonium polysaccharide biosynthesis protein HpsA, partial [Microcoleaceae cyanobacterium]